MSQNIQKSEAHSAGWRMLNKTNILQYCEVCGSEDQFLMSFTMRNSQSRQLCSGCYAQTISSRLYTLPIRA